MTHIVQLWKGHQIIKINATQEQRLLELYDFCNKKNGVEEEIKVFEKGILSGTDIHWYQLIIEYVMPIIFQDLWKWEENFMRTVILGKAHHPVDYLYDKYQKILNEENLYENTKHDYVLKMEEKAEKTKEREQKKKEDKKSNGK